jgi:hypothetical protein
MRIGKISLSKHTSATSPSDVIILKTVISFLVKVPVLSEHITVTQPIRR